MGTSTELMKGDYHKSHSSERKWRQRTAQGKGIDINGITITERRKLTEDKSLGNVLCLAIVT